jgi:hypothetical protein
MKDGLCVRTEVYPLGLLKQSGLMNPVSWSRGGELLQEPAPRVLVASGQKRKRSGNRGAPRSSPRQSLGQRPWSIDLQKLAGIRDRDHPRPHGHWDLANEVDGYLRSPSRIRGTRTSVSARTRRMRMLIASEQRMRRSVLPVPGGRGGNGIIETVGEKVMALTAPGRRLNMNIRSLERRLT